MGYLYVARNQQFLHLVKIGYTDRTIEERLRELNGTSVPGETVIAYWVFVNDAYDLESRVHRHFASQRDVKSKEWFRISPAKAREGIRHVAKEVGCTIQSEWSASDLNADDRRTIQAQMDKLRVEYQLEAERRCTSNPFLRARKLKAEDRIRELDKQMLSLSEKLLSLARK